MTRSSAADILCIGAQRAMTSWLHHGFSSHPGVWAFPNFEPLTSTSKEAHYWDWNRKRGPDWYRVLMRPLDDGLASLDFTPEYAFLDAAQIAECKALNPTARVIYILRDPLARAVSALRMHMLWRYGKDHADPLRKDDAFLELMRDARLMAHGDYLHNLRAWQRHYPDMIVLNYEDFHTDRAGSVTRIVAELGLDMGTLTPEGQKRLTRLMTSRVWESEKFPIDRAVLMFLHGLTWRFRQECQSALKMTFTEGPRLLDAS